MLLVGIRQQQREFIAAQPCHRVGFAQYRGEPFTNLLQNSIANLMTERVIDLLETIQIHHDQRERPFVAAGGQHDLP